MLVDATNTVRAGTNQRDTDWVKDYQAVCPLGWRSIPLKAESVLKGKMRIQLIVVLNEVTLGIDKQTIRCGGWIDAERRCFICLELRRRGISKCTGISSKTGPNEAPELSAELNGVLPSQQGRRIGEDAKSIVSSLRKSRRAPEVKAQVRHRNLRNTYRRVNTISNMVIDRVQQCIGNEDD